MKKVWLAAVAVACGLNVGTVSAVAAGSEPGGWAVSFSFSAEGLAKEETLFEYPGVVKAVVRFAGRRTLVCCREGRYRKPAATAGGKWRVVWPAK